VVKSSFFKRVMCFSRREELSTGGVRLVVGVEFSMFSALRVKNICLRVNDAFHEVNTFSGRLQRRLFRQVDDPRKSGCKQMDG